MDQQYTLHTALIALPRVLGPHTGGNIAISLVSVLEQYDICEKLGYMMLDNATNNDTAVESIEDELIWRGIMSWHQVQEHFHRVGIRVMTAFTFARVHRFPYLAKSIESIIIFQSSL
jgi:hypothetical protein